MTLEKSAPENNLINNDVNPTVIKENTPNLLPIFKYAKTRRGIFTTKYATEGIKLSSGRNPNINLNMIAMF